MSAGLAAAAYALAAPTGAMSVDGGHLSALMSTSSRSSRPALCSRDRLAKASAAPAARDAYTPVAADRNRLNQGGGAWRAAVAWYILILVVK